MGTHRDVEPHGRPHAGELDGADILKATGLDGANELTRAAERLRDASLGDAGGNAPGSDIVQCSFKLVPSSSGSLVNWVAAHWHADEHASRLVTDGLLVAYRQPGWPVKRDRASCGRL